MLGGIGKDAGLSAAQEAHKAVDGALDTLDNQTIPAAEAAARGIVLTAVNGAYGLLVDVLNRANGAEIPIDVTIRIQGKIGPLKLSVPEQMPAQTVEVRG